MLPFAQYVLAILNVILGSYQTIARMFGKALFAGSPRLPQTVTSTRRGVTPEISMATSELALVPGVDIRVTKLFIHPIKSCRGISVSESKYTPEGLQYDRQFVIVDAVSHKFLTARQLPKMVLIETAIEDEVTPLLVVSFPPESGISSFKVPLSYSAETLEQWEHISDVEIWKTSGLDAYVVQSSGQIDGSDTPSALLSSYLGRDVLLVLKGSTRRAAEPTSTHRDLDVAVRFQDGYPILLATTESLAAVQEKVRLSATGDESWKVSGISSQWQTEELAMERFRPNIVVSGSPAPFDEDYWRDVQIGDPVNGGGVVSLVKRCRRCLLPNIDVKTGVRDDAVPFKVITKFRRVEPEKSASACFGVNAVAKASGTLRVGDTLRVLTVLERETVDSELPL